MRLERPIKTLGLHDVRVDLHPEVAVEIQVNVARSAEEAEVQARGGDPTAMPEDDEDEEQDYEADELQDEVEGLGPQPDVDLPVDEQEEQARQ